MRPRLLLLDEPLASLDAARKRKSCPIWSGCATRRKVPMIYVSHDAGEVQRIASRVVRIEDGRCGDGGLELLDVQRRRRRRRSG